MALLTTDGKYVTIEDVKEGVITIRVHADANHRQRYKSGTETEFETTRQEHVSANVSLNAEIKNPGETIGNNIKIAGYEVLKGMELFAGAVDV